MRPVRCSRELREISETALSHGFQRTNHDCRASYEYTVDADGIIDYGDRTLFFPTVTPDADRYIAWATVVDLSDPLTRLLGPFDFQEPSHNEPDRTPSFRQYISLPFWLQLFELCLARGIQPPLLDMPAPLSPDNPPPSNSHDNRKRSAPDAAQPTRRSRRKQST